MLQRIQTLFLLASTTLLSVLFFAVMAKSPAETVKYNDIFALLFFNVITSLISFISIFLYRKRMIQIRFSIFNMIILVAYQSWIVYLFLNRPEGTAFSTTAVFPAVAAILTWLAFRYIARDEAMVRSVNRLRK